MYTYLQRQAVPDDLQDPHNNLGFYISSLLMCWSFPKPDTKHWKRPDIWAWHVIKDLPYYISFSSGAGLQAGSWFTDCSTTSKSKSTAPSYRQGCLFHSKMQINNFPNWLFLRRVQGRSQDFSKGGGSPSGDRRLYMVYTAALPRVSAGSVVLSRHVTKDKSLWRKYFAKNTF